MEDVLNTLPEVPENANAVYFGSSGTGSSAKPALEPEKPKDDGFNTIFPVTGSVKLEDGRTVPVPEWKAGTLPKISLALSTLMVTQNAMTQFEFSKEDLVELFIVQQPAVCIEMISITINWEVAQLEEISANDLRKLMMEVYGKNLSFFSRQAEIIKRLAEKAERKAEAAKIAEETPVTG